MIEIEVYTPDSSRVIHYTYVDMSARQIVRPVHLVQYDDGLPIIAAKLYNDGLEYTIPSDANVNIRYGKNDGKLVYNPALGCDEEKHTVYFEVTKQMTVVPGETHPIIEIEINNKIISSSAIAVQIDYNPVQEQSIKSTNEHITAKQYAEEAISASARANAYSMSAANYANTASSKALSAATDAANASKSATSAETSMTNAKTYADKAALSQQKATTSETNAKKSENSAANSASLAQSAYEEILSADIGKFSSKLANEHSILQQICDSNGEAIFNSNGKELQCQSIFVDKSEIILLHNYINNLESIVQDVLNKLQYLAEHSLLDNSYIGL